MQTHKALWPPSKIHKSIKKIVIDRWFSKSTFFFVSECTYWYFSNIHLEILLLTDSTNQQSCPEMKPNLEIWHYVRTVFQQAETHLVEEFCTFFLEAESKSGKKSRLHHMVLYSSSIDCHAIFFEMEITEME